LPPNSAATKLYTKIHVKIRSRAAHKIAFPLPTRITRKVNFLLDIRVSDRSRALFLSGTPVPLTRWKGVAYSTESWKNSRERCEFSVVGEDIRVGRIAVWIP
jgi:hypothetical protein